mmetsp:Transcript_36183/g.55573  ORF Transcript_36183/g.55573 Transcript_36183/m.55573 type:complete len:95 (-) Transcript_36183:325-609(-)
MPFGINEDQSASASNLPPLGSGGLSGNLKPDGYNSGQYSTGQEKLQAQFNQFNVNLADSASIDFDISQSRGGMQGVGGVLSDHNRKRNTANNSR